MKKLFLKKINSLIGEASTLVLLFSFFVFSIPFWRRIEILTPYSFLDGRFIDYLTYSVFGFDIILTLVFLVWAIKIAMSRKGLAIFDKKIFFSFIALLMVSALSLFSSSYRPLSIYYIIGLLFSFALLFFIYNNIKKKKDVVLVLNFFVLSMFFQSIIAILQFFRNQSLGLMAIGEQLFSPGISGVAKIVVDGEKHIRPYGTFSHPNILAFFLLVALISTIYLFFLYKERTYRVYLGIAFFSILFATFLTFSRVAWVLSLFSLVYISVRDLRVRGFLKRSLLVGAKKKKYLLLLVALILTVLFFFYSDILWRINPLLSSTWDSLRDRLVVFGKSWDLIRTHPWLGVGAGNFVIEVAYLLTGYPVWMAEPVHNTYLLILAEIGIFGLISFLFMLYYIYRKARITNIYFGTIFFIFVSYMFFDHCFWDVRQAQYLFFVFIGLILVLANEKVAK